MVLLDPGKYKARPRVPEPAGDGSSAHPKWLVGEQEYEALMRMLDNLVRITEANVLKPNSKRQTRKQPPNVSYRYSFLFFSPSRATEQVTHTVVRHCETKLKSTVMLRLPPLTEMTVTQVLAPH